MSTKQLQCTLKSAIICSHRSLWLRKPWLDAAIVLKVQGIAGADPGSKPVNDVNQDTHVHAMRNRTSHCFSSIWNQVCQGLLSQVALAFVQGLPSSLDPGTSCIC